MTGASSNVGNLVVVPFREGEQIHVLLVYSSEQRSWRLPSGLRHKGLTQHNSAALKARCDVGVSGRIFKQSLSSSAGARLAVFPLLVEDETFDSALEDRPTTQWFSLPDAVSVIDKDFRPALHAFAVRMALRLTRLGRTGGS